MVLINVMRGGPGLGSIGPSQSDYFQATKGHGHGDYRVPVLAPSSIAEAVELVADAFELAERYRTPVMILADGVIGQAMEPVVRRPTARPPDARWLGADRRRRPAAARRPLAPPPARGPRGAQPRTSRRSSRRSPSARCAGRPRTSTTPRSRSSPTARPRASPGRPSSGRASRACGSGSSGRSRLWPFPASALAPHRAAAARDRRRRAVGGPDGRGRPARGRGPGAGLLPRPDGRHGPDPGRGRRRAPSVGRSEPSTGARPRHAGADEPTR